jgi:hypothetical protein
MLRALEHLQEFAATDASVLTDGAAVFEETMKGTLRLAICEKKKPQPLTSALSICVHFTN